MASAEAEKEVFAQFMAKMPNFAGVAVRYEAGPNPPDFVCIDDGGVRIGVELSEWLDEEQIARERPRYKREGKLLSVIDSRGEQPPQNVASILIFENSGVRYNDADSTDFRSQLYAFVSELDAKWKMIDGHDHYQGAPARDFTGYPLLQKYVQVMMCWSRKYYPTQLGSEWITFMSHGGPYSPVTALKALEATLAKKTSKYGALHSDANLDRLFLLIYYAQGHHYNTPFHAPEHGFAEIAAHLKIVAAHDRGVFDAIFLFVPATGDVAKIY